MHDFSDVIGCFSQDIEIIRHPRGEYLNGRYRRQGSATVFKCRGSVQRPSDEERQELPENQRTQEAVSLYTVENLRAGNVSEDGEPDQICYQGRRFEVVRKRDWRQLGNYYRYLCVRVGQ